MAETDEPLIGTWDRDLGDLDSFVESSLIGLRHAREATGWVEVNVRLADLGKRLRGEPKTTPCPTAIQQANERAQRLERFAQREESLGYSYLYGLAVVRIWTILETLTDDVVLRFLSQRRFNVDAQPLASLKFALKDFVSTTPEDQAELILTELQRATRATLQHGVGRFEVLLDAVGLGGRVEEEPRRAIFECSHVRHLVVHRSGQVDARFLKACPWFNVPVGEPLPLQANHFRLYHLAAYWYALELEVRRRRAEGDSQSELVEVRDLFLQRVRDFQSSRPSGL